ncbi:MAG TPA: J domain-containing protein [Opitutaceae bacterium]|jgi:curved DNA-binding protein|nr:J domain-containing protein [Opitutaceae bacterium]
MPVQFKDYYQTLGVPRTATQDEIKAAFRKLARKYHPDVAKDKKGAEAKFKEINEANEVLSDPEKRRRYDELGADWNSAGPGAGGGFAGFRPGGRARGGPGAESFEFGGTGFSDFFEQFFGGGFDSFRRRRGYAEPETERGADVEADLLVTLEEALHGSTRQITLRRTEPDDRGRVDTYQVRIPPGIREGQRIRLAGQGSAGSGGAPAGDVYLRVKYAQHPDFTVDGADLQCDLELEPWQAVLGAKVAVPTLDGSVTLTVPAGTAAGSRLRLRGLGLPREGGDRGDMYARIRIQVPAHPTAEERSLYEKLAKAALQR